MEVGEVSGSDLGSSTVVVGSDGELQYDLGQQTSSFLTSPQIVQQGKASWSWFWCTNVGFLKVLAVLEKSWKSV